MTVENTNSTISYIGNGSVDTFAYNFLTYSAEHLFIYFDDVLQTSGFTITGIGDDNGGDVTFVSPPITGVTIRIDRTVPDTQLLAYQEYGPFPAKANERGLDLLTMAVQQTSRNFNRGKMDKRPLAAEDNIIVFDDTGNSKDSGFPVFDGEAKMDRIPSAGTGNFVTFDSAGNSNDSGINTTSFFNKMDKAPTSNIDNVVIFDSAGNAKDSGKKLNEVGNGGSYIGENPPTFPQQGDRWTRCTDMKGFIYYIDADSAQWVEDRPSYGEDTIGDVSVPYIFDTVADYQASTIVFPVGKTIHLNDRGADFTVIAGQSGDGSNEIPSASVSQSILLVDGFQLLAKENGILPSTDITSSLNVLLQRAKDNNGTSVGVESGSYDISDGVFIPHGCLLEGQGIPHTFTTYRDSAVFDINVSSGVNSLGVVLGEAGTSSALRNRSIQVKNIQTIGVTQQGLGFSTINDDDSGNVANSFNLQLDKCTTHSTFVGFKLINTFNNILNQCTAISTDTGFLITGNGAGGGTSSTYNNCLTYNSRIGWDFDAIGWGYSTMLSCGADGCDIGLRINSASNRGSTIRNFGIENIEVNGKGVLIDIAGSGYVEIDGLNIGANDDAGTTFITVSKAERVIIKNMDMSSSIINSCTVYTQSNPDDAGRVTFEDSDWFASSTDNFGDIFEENVILKNMRINGRLYTNAKGGLDESQQKAIYTSSSTNELGVNTPSKRLYSKKIIMDTNSDTFNRFVSGVPAYRTDNIADWTEITFINGTNPLNSAVVGFRSEDHTAGTGIIRDPALSTPTTITLSNVGDSVVFQKRPDGKLYQVQANNVGI